MIKIVAFDAGDKIRMCDRCGGTFNKEKDEKVTVFSVTGNEDFFWEVCPDCSKDKELKEIFSQFWKRYVFFKEQAMEEENGKKDLRGSRVKWC